MYSRTHLTILGFCAGIVWGGLAYLLAHRGFGPAIWPAVVACPVIGALVAHFTHPVFSRARGFRRALWSLTTLVLASILFALPMSVGEVARRGAAGVHLFENALAPVLAVLWGLTVTGLVLPLWPLAHLTHWVIEWRLGSDST
jgi:hypothetical protein